MSKTIKVMLEIPEKWVDMNDPLFGLGFMVREMFQKRLDKAVRELFEGGFELPELPKISPKEIKDRMIQILAEKALDKDL